MLADISKTLGKSFFLGAFLPAVFLVLNAAGGIVLATNGEVITEQIGLTLIAALCLAGVFLVATIYWSLNIWVVRFYEGYPVADWQFITRRLQSRREKIYKEIAGLKAKLRTQPSHRDRLRLTDLQIKAEVEFPPTDAELLPSKLGNIIRAFEYYPATRYSIESITLWPRLCAVMPADRLDAINTEKSLMDFWLNFSLALLTSSLFWAIAVWYREAALWPFSVLVFIGGSTLWYLAYRAAIPSAIAWGYEVRSAFDLYRSDLLHKLGFQRPASLPEEKALWDKIFWFFAYEEYAKRQGQSGSGWPDEKKGEEP